VTYPAEQWDFAVSKLAPAGVNYRMKLRELWERYAASNNSYHNFNHIKYVLNAAEELCDRLEVNDEDRAIVYMAAFYHDVDYVPGSALNEVRAAILFADHMPFVKRGQAVMRAILETAPGVAPQSYCGTLLVDADLAILGANKSDYALYVSQIRDEYPTITDEEFAAARADFLEDMLNNYAHIWTHTYDQAARANLCDELAIYRG
jgi:predicted metal-dependent HD superfamily phosphohydrolase